MENLIKEGKKKLSEYLGVSLGIIPQYVLSYRRIRNDQKRLINFFYKKKTRNFSIKRNFPFLPKSSTNRSSRSTEKKSLPWGQRWGERYLHRWGRARKEGERRPALPQPWTTPWPAGSLAAPPPANHPRRPISTAAPSRASLVAPASRAHSSPQKSTFSWKKKENNQ